VLTSLRLAFAASAAAIALALALITPWGRSLAQTAWRFLARTEHATSPLQPTQMATPDPAAPPLGVAELPPLATEDVEVLAQTLNGEPGPRTVAVFPAGYAPALAEQIQHQVLPLALDDGLAPEAIQAALGAALPRSGLVDVVLIDQGDGDDGGMVKRVRAALEQQLYRVYGGPGDSGAETFGALERKRYVAGYVPGVGLVTEDPTLRILAAPVTLRRGDFSVAVDHAFLYGDRTVVHYRVESATTYPFAEPGDDTCLEYAYLRLPDGSTLQPQPIGNGKAFAAGYEFATSFAAPIPDDVTEATLIIPCLLDSVRGATPEDWRLALSFTPAPADLALAPVYDGASMRPATDQGITLALAYVVAEVDGFVFAFDLTWDRDGEPAPDLHPGALHVTDAAGERILLSSASGRPPLPQADSEPFTFRTSEMPAPGPLTLTLEAVRASLSLRDVSFAFDPGSAPQPGQVWALDEHVSVAGYEWDILSVRLVGRADGAQGLEFTMRSADPGTMVELQDGADRLVTCEPAFSQGDVLSSTLIYENGIPAGPITVVVSQVSVPIPGDWRIRLAPSTEEAAAPAALRPIGVTFDNGIELTAGGALDAARPGEPLRVALEWRAEDQVDEPVKVFTHLTCGGQLIAQRDAVPGNGAFPAQDWRPGELIRDQFALQLPAELPAGDCQLEAGLYDPDTGRRYLPAGTGGAPHIVVQQVAVAEPGSTP
jgi:hypothetical protein